MAKYCCLILLVVVLESAWIKAQSSQIEEEQEIGLCVSFKKVLQKLSQEIEELCSPLTTMSPTTSSECSCSNVQPNFNWTSIPRTEIGSSTLRANQAFQSYRLPSYVPSTAKEVLVHVIVMCGRFGDYPNQYIKLYAKDGLKQYEKYIFMRSWNTNSIAVNSNSDNMWFPVTSDRKIHMEVPGAAEQRCPDSNGKVFVIGYR